MLKKTLIRGLRFLNQHTVKTTERVVKNSQITPLSTFKPAVFHVCDHVMGKTNIDTIEFNGIFFYCIHSKKKNNNQKTLKSVQNI